MRQVVQSADRTLRKAAPPLWVRGEVSGWKRYPSGHCYFTLKDEHAELCCVLWADAARALPALPGNGMEIDAFGQLGIHARKGQFQLQVSRLEATGAGGLWRLAMERLVAQLRREGLLDEERKRPLPAYPERIGIATSTSGAVLQDMLRALRRKAWWTQTLVSHSSVEGAGAAPEIASAIRRFGTGAADCRVEVLIVARGGGSAESLWAYNTEPVARAIAACPVPVISAVGHETDWTVADMVADLRAATPTAGAERAVPEGREVLHVLTEFPAEASARMERIALRQGEQLRRGEGEIRRALLRRMGALDLRVAGSLRHLEARSPRQALRRAGAEAGRAVADLHAAMERRLRDLAREAEEARAALDGTALRRLEHRERDLAVLAEALEARSPLAVLARGYAVVSDRATGRVVRSAGEVRPEQQLLVRLADGEFPVRAEPDASS